MNNRCCLFRQSLYEAISAYSPHECKRILTMSRTKSTITTCQIFIFFLKVVVSFFSFCCFSVTYIFLFSHDRCVSFSFSLDLEQESFNFYFKLCCNNLYGFIRTCRILHSIHHFYLHTRKIFDKFACELDPRLFSFSLCFPIFLLFHVFTSPIFPLVS